MPRKIYHGVCAACLSTDNLHQDYKVPRMIGGDNFERQGLCLVCHQRKKVLEKNLFSFYGASADLREWLALAFQEDTKLIDRFVSEMQMKINHLDEVVLQIKNQDLPTG